MSTTSQHTRTIAKKCPGLICLADVKRPPQPKHGQYFGRWYYNGENLTLEFRERRNAIWSYYIDLEECVDACTIMDRILQVAGKTWATAEDIGNLVLALERLAGGLQGKVLGGRVDYRQLLRDDNQTGKRVTNGRNRR
jgi:hypothetical protein